MKQMMQEANAAHEANEANVFPTSERKAELGAKMKKRPGKVSQAGEKNKNRRPEVRSFVVGENNKKQA